MVKISKLIAVTGCLLLANSCRTAPEPPTRKVRAPLHALSRCGFLIDGRWHHVDNPLFRLYLAAPEQIAAVRELIRTAESALVRGAAGTDGGGAMNRDFARPRGDFARPTRTYEPTPRDPGVVHLTVLDFADGLPDLEVIAAKGQQQARFSHRSPSLAFLFRQGALSSLAESVGLERFPSRRPLAWHGAALASFLAPGVLHYDGDWQERGQEQIRRLVNAVGAELERLTGLQAAEQTVRQLVRAVPRLTSEDVTRFARDERTAVRLVALTHRAWSGDREALGEILTQSLEYGGDVRVFGASIRTLFPAQKNEGLYPAAQVGSSEDDIRLLTTVEKGFASAVHHSGEGWSIPE